MFSTRLVMSDTFPRILKYDWQQMKRYYSNVIKSPTLTLYGDDVSPPVRFVKMTAACLKVPLKYREIDLFKGEHQSDYYRNINPLKKVPALVIGDQVLLDSHAIALYLCETFRGYDLYPKEPLERAKINQILFFNCGHLFPFGSALYGKFFGGQWSLDDELISHCHSAFEFLENLLQEQAYLAGDRMSLCDVCCGSTVSSIDLLLNLLNKYEYLSKWMTDLKERDFFDINTQGLKKLRVCMESITH